MFINGIVFEDAGCWLADIPALDLMVPGESAEDAFTSLQEVFAEEFPKIDAKFDWMNPDAGVFTVELKKPGQVFHEMIRRQREASEISMSQAAKRMKKMDQKQWSEIESGTVQSTTAQFVTMLDALDMDVFISVKKRT